MTDKKPPKNTQLGTDKRITRPGTSTQQNSFTPSTGEGKPPPKPKK